VPHEFIYYKKLIIKAIFLYIEKSQQKGFGEIWEDSPPLAGKFPEVFVNKVKAVENFVRHKASAQYRYGFPRKRKNSSPAGNDPPGRIKRYDTVPQEDCFKLPLLVQKREIGFPSYPEKVCQIVVTVIVRVPAVQMADFVIVPKAAPETGLLHKKSEAVEKPFLYRFCGKVYNQYFRVAIPAKKLKAAIPPLADRKMKHIPGVCGDGGRREL